MFINFTSATGVHVLSYRRAETCSNLDVTGLIEDIRAHRSASCPLAGARAALEDGSLWTDEDQFAIELVYAAITDHGDNRS